MAVMNFKTRGTQTVQGKQKAYFCAHPDDYGRYFESVTEEILGVLEKEGNHNCAFLYLEDPRSARDDAFFFDLKEMDLVVMPVTSKLLTTANPALDIDFKFASEKGLTILPLMMEAELGDEFNAKCGDLQYLDPNSHDITAISYKEKLTKFLTSVLIGDELAEKIRNAFDAYIFLSYRKKDRQYAQELMRLIHKNDFCRDIAIWYDEFLIPGENFNKSIEGALEKSKFFALAVTPSLLEKSKDKDGNECENYIVTTEYPMARKAKKPILPAELVETDKKALADKYNGIPDCINAKDEFVLTKSLENVLKGIALRENDNDPGHNFFIGLAYFGGIDVEKNHERAVALITSAAEAGLPEAMEKLVSIYRNGEAGKRDYDKAIEWQTKLTVVRKDAYEEDKNEDTAGAYLSAAKILCNLIYDFRSIDEAEIVNKEMLSVSKDICGTSEKRWAHIQKCYSMGFLADYERVNEEMKIFMLIDNLASGYDRLGNICLSRGDLSSAEEYFSKSHRIRERLADEIDDDYAKSSVSWGYDRLGDVYFSRGEYSKAKKFYLMSLDLQRKFVAKDENSFRQSHIIITYNCLIEILAKLKDYDAAEKYCHEVMDIREKCADSLYEYEPDSYGRDRDDSVSYDRLGDICKSRGDLDGAEKHYQRSFEIRNRIVLEVGEPADISALAISCDKLGDVYKERDDCDGAEKWYKRSLEIREELSSETPKVQYAREMQHNYLNLGGICLRREDYDGAEDFFVRALAINEKLASKTGRVQAKRDLAINYVNLGIVSSRRGDMDKAEDYFVRAIDIQEKILADTESVRDQIVLADLNYHAGLHLHDKKKKYLYVSYDIWHLLLQKDPENAEYASQREEVRRAIDAD